MKRHLGLSLIWVLTLTFALLLTACGGGTTPRENPPATSAAAEPAPAPAETTGTEAPEASSVDLDISTNDKSVDLPTEYPADLMPIYPDSYIESVVAVDQSFTIIGHTQDETDKVIAFYKDAVGKGKINAESSVEQTYTVMGTRDAYTFQLTIAPEEDRDDYETMFAIMVFPN